MAGAVMSDVDEVVDLGWMQRALDLAHHAQELNEVPVGAVVVFDGRVVGSGWNHPIAARDPTAHAEIIALRSASTTLDNYRIPGSTLYATLEPCAMCYAAMVYARVARLVYGAADLKSGALTSVLALPTRSVFNHQIEVTGGVLAEPCGEVLREFFRQRR
jgi:tRNA(adenine34) deaminase